MPPTAHPMTLGGRGGRLFKADDVRELAKRFEIDIVTDDAIPDAVAHDLDEAFDDAVTFQRSENRKSSPSELVEWFQDIEIKAGALLNVMGFPPGKATLHNPDFTYPMRSQAVSSLIEGVFLNPSILPPYMLLPEQVRHALNDGKDGPTVNDLMNGRIEVPEGVMPYDHLMLMSRLAACSLLGTSPWIVALIAEVGRLQADFYSEKTGKRGDRKDCFVPILFARLYGAYVKMTGLAPTLRINRDRNPDAPAVLWAKAVCELSLSEMTLNGKRKRRIEHVIRPIFEDEIERIRAIARLSGETIVAHFERGKKDWKMMQRQALHQD